ncbi:sigma 54-interacting transcriptional regulator [Sporolactobacillus shoreicorticis]|uniref:Sigma 54-interacting transcriptional regulator n=1 Tax=Sporolactobacillus shoreicorticis TaxID=1923877 RepID=A0ABW5RXP2_9BACL|nr:sigma 54-interacting transcriptional regulator [Sporolactobacillus shoreicorticis]MCO7124961.1 sigma 54-interacting transcriptional regulator [Sporolactobacillus shoreicorticis]
MTRREKVLTYLEKCIINKPQGVTTSEISEAIGVLRPNVSKELNQLVREGRVKKINGRPVHYLMNPAAGKRETKVQQKPNIGFAGSAQIQDQRVKKKDTANKHEIDVFENMIGSRDSLKNQVEQAKAALLYPPHGLNTLIIGPTGSGKTYFAHKMYHFALNKKIISKKGFTTFNCADYAHNPQLLMSHLFGYVKGAFTGASADKDGLIQEADGGMLFLDEVHRLPPEGQEMIFYFMDHGTYSRLGETAKTHHADVRLVFATTEDPKSSLLQTFVRRIPVIIQLPDFNQRSAREKLKLLEQLLTLEANRIHKNIRLNEDVVQALLGSVTYGNIGQLKSNIQLVCAQGFLNSMHDKNEIALFFNRLPPDIKDGLSNLASDRKELGNLSRLLEATMVIKPDAERGVPDIDSYELPYNLYEIIGDKAALLKEEGLNQAAINNFIMTDINLHLKSFYRQGKLENTVGGLNEIVDQEVIDITKQIQQQLQEKENYPVRDNFIYAMSLHISSFIKRVQSGKPLRTISADLISMLHDYPSEIKIAERVKTLIEEHYRFPIPESEVYYMAILLVSLKSDPKTGKVGIVVAAHGNSTASSMVQVVTQLLSVNNIAAYDMPLEMSPKIALDGIAAQVKKIDQGSGVLLLVDMGSLSTFSSKLTEKTHVHVKTIDMVTTAMVLEAARKTALIDSDLETVYRELREFDGYSRTVEKVQKKKDNALKRSDQREKAIIAICSTGEGTARKIKDLLDKILIDNLIDDITVITVSLVKMNDQIAEIQQNYQIVAATGIVKPHVAVPFVSLENLLQGGGEHFVSLIEELNHDAAREADPLNHSQSLTKEMIQNYLGQYFTFINPAKIVNVLLDYCDFIQRRCRTKMSNAFKISLIMHMAGALERYLTRSEMSVDEKKLSHVRMGEMYPIIKQAGEILHQTLNIKLSENEVYYIVELFNTEKEKNDTQNN